MTDTECALKRFNITYIKYMDRIYISDVGLIDKDKKLVIRLGFTYNKKSSSYVEDL